MHWIYPSSGRVTSTGREVCSLYYRKWQGLLFFRSPSITLIVILFTCLLLNAWLVYAVCTALSLGLGCEDDRNWDEKPDLSWSQHLTLWTPSGRWWSRLFKVVIIRARNKKAGKWFVAWFFILSEVLFSSGFSTLLFHSEWPIFAAWVRGNMLGENASTGLAQTVLVAWYGKWGNLKNSYYLREMLMCELNTYA